MPGLYLPSGTDQAAARLTDPRFYGIQRVDLRAKYGAILDGASHPMTAAAAVASYPNISVTGSTIERDTAAWLQAEYDLRTGAGGIIGLPEAAMMMVSQTLYMQNARKVWFHGSRNAALNTLGCGTTPAIRISNGGGVGQVLYNFELLAKGVGVSPSVYGGGTAHTGYQAGAIAFQIDNCQGIDIDRVGWSGYDKPFLWGDNTYGISFRNWGAGGNNYGVNWNQTAGLNSMERIRFHAGASANNNYGAYLDATYANGAASQGGSLFFTDNAFDYNIVRHIHYIGQPSAAYTSINELHVTGNHIETTGACSGSSLCRIYSQGAAFFSDNAFFEDDLTVPPGFIEVADYTATSVINNRLNSDRLPFCWSGTGNFKRVNAAGNVAQSPNVQIIGFKDSTGSYPQSDLGDDQSLLLFDDSNAPIPFTYYKKKILLDYFKGPGSIMLPSDAQADFPINAILQFSNINNVVTFVGSSGVSIDTFPANAPKLVNGATCYARKHDHNHWVLYGALSS